MNQRLTAAAAIAVILASTSEFFLISGIAWLIAAIGAVAVVALAGLLTRLAPVPAAIAATVLAALATVPAFVAGNPALKAAGAAVVICCAASATRWRVLRVVSALVTYLAALLLYVNALRASAQSVGLLVPTRASLHHLLTLASSGLTQAKAFPPVGETSGVILLAAGSIGLAAIVVDFIAVRLHRPAIAGLPLLVIYLAPLATTAHVEGPWGITAFVAASAGYLGLLASDGRNRLRGWGRVISVWHRPGETERLGGADVTALAATGRRIGVAALCAAVVAPLLLPTLNLHRLFGSGSGGASGFASLPNPVVQLHAMLAESTPQTVLTYRSSAPGQYLPIYVMTYDSQTSKWVLGSTSPRITVRSASLLSPPGLASNVPQANAITTSVELNAKTGYSSQYLFLPVPYWPERVSVSGTWWESDNTLMIYSNRAGQEASSYTVTSGQVNPTPDILNEPQRVPASLQAYLSYDSPVRTKLLQLANHITAGQPTEFDKAVALERWFQSGKFFYSIQSTVPDTPQGLLDFLTTEKEGFCQQFAIAMAVLARLVGIPSRIAVGFTAGTLHGSDWVVSTADAHAWPELYFTNVGWLRFEPTPGGTRGQGTAVQPSYVTSAKPVTVQPTGPTGPTTGPKGSRQNNESSTLNKLRHLNAGANDAGPGISPAAARKGGGGSALPAELIALAVLLLASTVPGTARVVARRRRWNSAQGDLGLAKAAWQEVRADLTDLGIPCRVSDSPRAVARRVCSTVESDEAAQQAIGRIASVVERAYYAPAPASASNVRQDVAVVRHALASNLRWPARWQARLFPASILDPARTAVRRTLGSITGWVPTTREELAS